MHAAGNAKIPFCVDLKFGVPGLERALAGQPGTPPPIAEARPLQNKPAPAWRWIKPVCQIKTGGRKLEENYSATSDPDLLHF